jgi:uncharacterized surface protein with fasciclin (FAS1) repeats
MPRVLPIAVVTATVAASGIAPAAAAAHPPAARMQTDIVDTATAAGQFKTLTSLLERSGLAPTLKGPGPYTVFAPTDAAFAKVPRSTLKRLAANRSELRAVLLYHVVKGRVTASELARHQSVRTLEGGSLRVRSQGGEIRVNRARVVRSDITASNGVIHVINRVLIPTP